MIPDSYTTELRLKAVRELPWPIPAAVLIDLLAAASQEDYWRVLNGVVRRVGSRSATMDRSNKGAPQ